MPKTVKMPDGTVVAFPDEMSDDDIAAVLRGQHPAAQKGFLQSASDSSGLSQILHPIDTLKQEGSRVASQLKEAWNTPTGQPVKAIDNTLYAIPFVGGLLKSSDEAFAEGKRSLQQNGMTQDTRRSFGRSIPIAGPALAEAQQQYDDGNGSGAAGTLAGTVLGLVGPKAGGKLIEGATDAVKGAPNAVARLVGGTELDKPIMGDTVTPRQRYAEAKAQGVNPDLAQATNAAGPKMVKKPVEHSLMGGSRFEANQAANTEALQKQAITVLDNAHPDAMSGEEFGNQLKDLLAGHRDALETQAGHPERAQALLNSITPDTLTRQEFGTAAQEALRKHQAMLYEQAGKMFDDLTSQVGGHQPDMLTVRKTAKNILDTNSRYYKNNPDMLSGQTGRAWSAVNRLADLKSEVPTAQTWSDLHKLRSDLMNMYRSPDIVGTGAEGWLKQLAGSVDESMTGANSGLSPAEQTQFRDANKVYTTMKDTYDNPQSPLYHAVRSPDPLTVANMLAKVKPSVAGQIKAAAAEMEMPELQQQLQRQAVERLLDPPGNGKPDFKGLPSRFDKAGKEEMASMLSPKQMADVEDLSRRVAVEGPYDNPRSDVYKILNAKDGVTAADVATAAGSKGFQQIAGAAKAMGDNDSIPQLQRQAMGKIISPPGNDLPDLQNLGPRLKRANKEQLYGMLSPKQIQQMEELARAARTVNYDSNTSGSGKVVQASAEGKAALASISTGVGAAAVGHPLVGATIALPSAAWMGASRAAANLMTNPSVVDAVMNAKSPTPVRLPVPGGSGVANSVVAQQSKPQGEDRWAQVGIAKLQDHLGRESNPKLTAQEIEDLGKTRTGKSLLIFASDLQPGSKAMKSLVERIRASQQNSQ